MRIVQLTKINSDRSAQFRDSFSDTDDVTEGQPQVAPAVETSPVSINADSIRCFYPRKNSRPGTRLTFKDGGGFAVTETYDEVLAKVALN